MNAATWEWHITTNKLIINERWAEMVGYTLAELEPTTIDTWLMVAHPDDIDKSNKALNAVFNKEEEYYVCEVRMLHKDGSIIWVYDSGMVIEWSEDGSPLIVIGTHIDITDKMNTLVALKESERNLRQIIENTKDIIYRLDLQGNMIYLSPAWTEQLGYSIDEGLNNSFQPFVHEEDLADLNQFFEELIRFATHQEHYNYRILHKDGSWKHFETSASAIMENNLIVGFVGTARDITEIIKKQREIEYLSYHDQLTSFGNRHLLDKLESEIIHPSRFPLATISIDLNFLKHVNDNYGHHVGDKLLQKAAEIIKENCLDTDYLFRMGGDEFLLFLPNTNDVETRKTLKNIDSEVKKHYRSDFPLSLAVGYFISQHPTHNLYEDIRKADQLMYRNKKNHAKSKIRLS